MALLLAPLRWLTSSIIRLALFAGVLLLIWFLLLKPLINPGGHTARNVLHSLEKKASPVRLEHCIQHADGDVEKIKRCARIF